MVIQKRDKSLVAFNGEKIKVAIQKAFADTCEVCSSLALEVLVTNSIALAIKESKCDHLTVEEIQDAVVQTLGQEGFPRVASAYQEYRSKHAALRQLAGTELDYKTLVENYLGENDWRVKENATVSYSLGGLILHNSGAVTANYWLSEIYDKEIAQAHRNADMHIHDLSMLSGYCAGWSLQQVIEKGIVEVNGKICSAPAKHLSTLCNQLVNFLGIMQNEWAGAQALSSFDTYLASFVKADGLSYKQVKQCIQSFIYGVNTPSRWGTQAPFSNVTLDWVVPADLADRHCIIGGKEVDFCYKDCQAEMDLVNKAFIEIMLEGDANGNGFQYPIPTYSITKEFNWGETENNRLLFEMTAKYGTPYFSNYVNSDMKPSDVRSMCCRLRLDLRELSRKSGGYFGSGENTGSIGVVTINLPRIAYLSNNRDEFFTRLDSVLSLAGRSLHLKREYLNSQLEHGLYPYTKAYLKNFNNHFSTIGVVGMHEACLNAKWISGGIVSDDGKKFALDVLDFCREKLITLQEKYGALYNLEATPAESTSYRLAMHDKKKYPGIITSGTDSSPYYTNSTQLPVDYTSDLFDALDFQDDLQVKYNSGTVFHAFVGEMLPDWESTAKLVRKIAENYKLPYFTISPTYSVCKEHGYLSGEKTVCPKCGKPTQVFSRITGYYRPVSNWNDGKKQEFSDRKVFNLSGQSEPVLVTTESCPKCVMVKRLLDEKGIVYNSKLASECAGLVDRLGIVSVPTLVVRDTIYTDYPEIKEWVDSHEK